MQMLILLAAWSAVVVFVVAVVTRPWKSPAARAPLPLALAVAAAAWVLATGFASYRNLMADGAWTGATVAMVFVPGKAIIFSLLAYAVGRTFVTARSASDPPAQRWGLPAVLAGLMLYMFASDVLSLHRAALEQHARDPTLSAGEVQALVQRIREGDATKEELGAFLGNPLCPTELLAEHAASTDPYWRKAVARNDKIDAALAEKLAGDTDEEVRYYLAFNRNLPPAILSRLAADTSEMVRDMVAWTDSLPDEDFNRLVDDPSPKVRATVALQSRISAEALARLRNDPEQRVRDAANRWAAE